MSAKLPSVSPELAPGALVAGQWRIESQLSRTRSSIVYRAHHARTKVPAAVKVLAPPGGVLQTTVEARFEREAMTTARLTSPNVLRVWDFGHTPSRYPYIVMELLDGVTLRYVLDERRADGNPGIPPGAALGIADAVLRGLVEAHANEIVHRGVKPANIFLCTVPGGDVIVKLIDFGAAKDMAESLTSTGERVGTPTHMSPEQTRGKGVDGRTDLYSLGVVLYECLAGQLPFTAPTPLALAVAHASQPPPPMSELTSAPIPAELEAVVLKALEKSPDDRWPDAISMRDALHAVSATVDPRGLLRGALDLALPLIQRQQDAVAAQAIASSHDEQMTGPLSIVQVKPRSATPPVRRPSSRVPKVPEKAPATDAATVMMDLAELASPPPLPPPAAVSPRRPTPAKVPRADPNTTPPPVPAKSPRNRPPSGSAQPVTRVNRFASQERRPAENTPSRPDSTTVRERRPGLRKKK